jgi:hypothetical protein
MYIPDLVTSTRIADLSPIRWFPSFPCFTGWSEAEQASRWGAFSPPPVNLDEELSEVMIPSLP